MTRKIIQIPMEFQFEPISARWAIGIAQIESWKENTKKIKSLIPRLGPIDDLTVKVVPVSEPEHCEKPEFEGFAMTLRKADIPAVLAARCGSPVENPDLAEMHSENNSFEIMVCLGRDTFKRRTADAWDMLDAFFGLRGTTANLKRFLDEWGVWRFDALSPLGRHLPEVLLPHLVWDFQGRCREALKQPAKDWLSKPEAQIPTHQREKFPHFFVPITACERAIEVAITLDMVRKIKTDFCRRKDCGKPFKLTSLHKRKYCSPECAHLVSVRNSRKRNPKKS
jgi:hypothetical protein